MPWPEQQRKAIFLSTKREQGEQAAKEVMHEAGYGQQRKAKKSAKPGRCPRCGGRVIKGRCAKCGWRQKS
jgi:hypothetical protein